MIQQILAIVGDRDAYFWRTHQGAELDLLVMRGGKRYGFEIKLAEAPTITKSMRIAHEELRLERLFAVHAGADAYALSDDIQAVPVQALPKVLARLR